MLKIIKINDKDLLYTCECLICKNISQHKIIGTIKEYPIFSYNNKIIKSIKCTKCEEKRIEKEKLEKTRVKNKFQLIRF